MKLLSATSFFFFALLIFLVGCNSDRISYNNEASLTSILEGKVYQSSRQKDYDSAIFYAHKILDIAERKKDSYAFIIAYDKLSRHKKNLKQYDSAIYFGEKFYAVSKETKDTINMAKASFRLGLYYQKKSDFRKAYINFNTSKKLYLKLGDTVRLVKSINNISQIQKKIGSFGDSQLSALEGLRYIEETDNIKIISQLKYLLAVSSKEVGNYAVAERKINEALHYVTDINSIKKIGIANIYKFKNTKANILLKQGKYDQAIEIYNELLNDSERQNDFREKVRVNNNLGKALFLKNGFNFESEFIFYQAGIFSDSIRDMSLLFANTINKAKFYREKNLQKSLSCINEALCLAEKMENENSIHEALELKMKYDDNIQKQDKDYYLLIDDILKKKRQDISTLYAISIYDHNEAERKQAFLLKKSTQKTNQLLILSLILLIVLISTFLIYQKIKRRHKIEKVKTVHNTEVRISTKVHDELANDIHYLLAQLETSNPDKEAVLDRLDVIYNNARDISKQNRSVETGEGFPDELTNLFRSYQSDEVNVILKRYDIDIWNGISEHIKVTLYRVLQELLTNMKKHSNATLVAVSIEKYKKELFVQFKDNGKGFSEGISKNGLLNAENRIHAIKGKLTFDTELHQGCKFSINVPL